MRLCEWDYCQTATPEYRHRCRTHRDMKWWEEYIEHLQHVCHEEEELPLDEYEDALDIIYEARDAGGPKAAALRIEEEHGINPTIFSSRFEGNEMLKLRRA